MRQYQKVQSDEDSKHVSVRLPRALVLRMERLAEDAEIATNAPAQVTFTAVVRAALDEYLKSRGY